MKPVHKALREIKEQTETKDRKVKPEPMEKMERRVLKVRPEPMANRGRKARQEHRVL